MRKFMLLCACLFLTIALLGCDQTGSEVLEDIDHDIQYEDTLVEVPEDENEEFYIDWYAEEEMTWYDMPFLYDLDDMFFMSGEHNPELVAILLTDDAYVHTDVESFLVFTTNMSKSDVVDFIMDAIEDIGATVVLTGYPWPDTWAVDSELPDGNLFSVEIRDADDEDGVVVMVMY